LPRLDAILEPITSEGLYALARLHPPLSLDALGRRDLLPRLDAIPGLDSAPRLDSALRLNAAPWLNTGLRRSSLARLGLPAGRTSINRAAAGRLRALGAFALSAIAATSPVTPLGERRSRRQRDERHQNGCSHSEGCHGNVPPEQCTANPLPHGR
jgi:hypothetical protein